jgi:GNAT superfamily N-acetyltransferase
VRQQLCDEIEDTEVVRIWRPAADVHVRPFRRTDRDAVLRMHARCSRATRTCRWLAPSPDFPLSYLRSLLAVTADHIAVVAVTDTQPSEVIGLASAALTSDCGWELGVLVEDRFQAQGIGRLMVDRLIELIGPTDPLCAYLLTENRWLLGKLARFGALRISHDTGVSHASVDRTTTKAKSR